MRSGAFYHVQIDIASTTTPFFFDGADQSFCRGGARFDAIQFDPSALMDLETLRAVTGEQIGYYMPKAEGLPPLLDELYSKLRPDDYGSMWVHEERSTEEVFAALVHGAGPVEVSADTTIYRARVMPASPTEPVEYDAPPLERVRAGRFNREGMQVFYGAFDIETCLLELRLGPEDISRNTAVVARLLVCKPLRVLDLTGKSFLGSTGKDFFDKWTNEDPGATMRYLLFPTQDNYHLTQALSAYLSAQKFDGFIHPSAMQHLNRGIGGKNIVLFGQPLADGRLHLTSLNRVFVKRVSFDVEFGPVWSNMLKYQREA